MISSIKKKAVTALKILGVVKCDHEKVIAVKNWYMRDKGHLFMCKHCRGLIAVPPKEIQRGYGINDSGKKVFSIT